jgi:hypothetical protein
MEVRYTHNLQVKEAADIVEKTLNHIRLSSGKIEKLRWKWNEKGDSVGFVTTAMGFDVKGKIAVSDKDIVFEATLPFMALAFTPEIKMELDKAILAVAQGKVKKE